MYEVHTLYTIMAGKNYPPRFVSRPWKVFAQTFPLTRYSLDPLAVACYCSCCCHLSPPEKKKDYKNIGTSSGFEERKKDISFDNKKFRKFALYFVPKSWKRCCRYDPHGLSTLCRHRLQHRFRYLSMLAQA